MRNTGAMQESPGTLPNGREIPGVLSVLGVGEGKAMAKPLFEFRIGDQLYLPGGFGRNDDAYSVPATVDDIYERRGRLEYNVWIEARSFRADSKRITGLSIDVTSEIGDVSEPREFTREQVDMLEQPSYAEEGSTTSEVGQETFDDFYEWTLADFTNRDGDHDENWLYSEYYLQNQIGGGAWKQDLLGSHSNRAPLGRIYCNLNPNTHTEVHQWIISKLKEVDRPISGKSVSEPEEGQRADNVVFYCADLEVPVILGVLEEASALFGESVFGEETPRFTANLTASDGKVMKGVAFGEDPTDLNTRSRYGRGSFGARRASYLEYLVHSNYNKEYVNSLCGAGIIGSETLEKLLQGIEHAEHFRLVDYLTKEEFQAAYDHSLIEANVDPAQPAFNLRDNPKRFAITRTRLHT